MARFLRIMVYSIFGVPCLVTAWLPTLYGIYPQTKEAENGFVFFAGLGAFYLAAIGYELISASRDMK